MVIYGLNGYCGLEKCGYTGRLSVLCGVQVVVEAPLPVGISVDELNEPVAGCCYYKYPC